MIASGFCEAVRLCWKEMRIVRKLWYLGIVFICAGCASISSHAENLYISIARDILSRMEHDFFWNESEIRNALTILHDCEWEHADLTGAGTKEVVVKVNWFSDGRFGISKGYNYVRGAHGQGDFFLYAVRDENPTFIGKINGGSWKLLSTRSEGYADIETDSHEAWNEAVVNMYQFSKGKYELTSSILYKFDEDGNREELRSFK